MSNSEGNNTRSQQESIIGSPNSSSTSENVPTSPALESDMAPVHEESVSLLPQTIPHSDPLINNLDEDFHNTDPEEDGDLLDQLMETIFSGEDLANGQHPITMLNHILLSEFILDGLQPRKYHPNELEANGEKNICCICMDELGNEGCLVKLDCNHHFHFKCIKQWLMERNQCPTCRQIGISFV